MHSTVVKKGIKNLKAGLFNQLITLVLGIVLPRLVLVTIGSEANGLLNSANQAVVYLALLEGGIGWSITQSLYGPVARKDTDEINGIMSASNIFYKNVGKLYLLGTIIVAFAYTALVQTSLTKTTVFIVVVLTALPQAINFWFQGKYRTLLSVDGRGSVLSNLNTVVYIGTSFSKIALLLSGFNVIALQVMYCCFSLAQMIFITYYVKKVYPWLNIKVKPLKEKIGQRKSVFIHQISGFIFSNTDMVLLSVFCNLKIVSVYAMYNMFASMINTLIGNVTGSVTFAMGQKYNTDREGYLKYHYLYETICMVLVFSLDFVLLLCILPFLKIYTKGITDINYIDGILPWLFIAIQMLQYGRVASQKVIEYAGAFKDTQWHSVIEMVVNILVSVTGVIKFGIYGVLLGTIVSLGIRCILMIYYSSRKILCISQKRVYVKWGINILIFAVLYFIMSQITVVLDSYIKIVIYAVVLLMVSVISFGGCALVYDKEFRGFIRSRLSRG